MNIQSVDGSEVLYAIEEEFTPPDLAGLQALPMGMTALKSEPGGLALDFVREYREWAADGDKGADDSVAEDECQGKRRQCGGGDDSAGAGEGARKRCGDAG